MSETTASRRNRHAAPIGIIFILLCIIGVCTVFKWCFSATKYLADNTAQKTKYEEMLLPVVMFDPANFTDPATCDNEFLLQSSLWACMLGEDRDSYSYDEFDRLIIPSTDVDAMASTLFGPGVKLQHMTIGDMDNSYLYDETISSYHVPIIAMAGFATPKVEKIVSQDSALLVTIGYVPPTTVLSINYSSSGKTEEAPSKYMLYELRKNDDGYYVYAISSIDTGLKPDLGDYPDAGTQTNTDALTDDAAPEDSGLANANP